MKKLIERVLGLFVTDNRYSMLSQRQVEAFTDIVSLAMIIDRHVAESERDLITEMLAAFEWPEQRPSEHFINRSVQRAWSVLDSDTFSADVLTFCKNAAGQLQHDWLLEEAFVAVTRVIQADARIEPTESELIQHLQEAFDYNDDRVEALTARALRANLKSAAAVKPEEVDDFDDTEDERE